MSQLLRPLRVYG